MKYIIYKDCRFYASFLGISDYEYELYFMSHRTDNIEMLYKHSGNTSSI